MAEQGMVDLDCLADLDFHDIKGKAHPKADSIISRGHRDSVDRGFYLIGANVELVDPPRDHNNFTAIVKATTRWKSIVADESGDFPEYVFSEIGDANADNTSAQIAPHYIRMASTRAMGRSIAMALNIKEALAEEMLENGTVPTASNTSRTTTGTTKPSGGGNAGAPDDLGSWNGNLWYGSDKGKHYTDKSISVKTLQWGADKTNDDKQRTALLNEIARREGGGSSAPAPSSSGGSDPNWKPSAKDIGDLVKLGQAVDMNFPAIKVMAAENFEGKNDPAKLSKDEFNLLRVMLGGDEI